MKTINAVTAQSLFASLNLRDRRAYANMDTAWLKRSERRNSRRTLKAELQGMTYEGIHRDFGMSRLAVMEKVRESQSRSNHEFEFTEFIKETNRPLIQRAVTVIRKRADFRRPLVETLMVPA
jgi:hypothetical protein